MHSVHPEMTGPTANAMGMEFQIPIDDGGHGDQDYQNTTFNVTRMTYVFKK